MLKNLFESTKEKFLNALETESDKDENIYSSGNMLSLGQEFLAQIDPSYIKDIQTNKQWYQEFSNEILFNVGYPAR